MGRERIIRSYDENVDKAKVFSELNHIVSQATWRECGNGLYSNIRWIDYICNDEYEATQYMEDNRADDYDNIAVKFRETVLPKTKAFSDLQAKKKDIDNAILSIAKQPFATEFISCKKCKSKLATKYLKAKRCLLCGAELLTKTEATKINKLSNKWQDLNEKGEEMKKQASQKYGKVKWMVKVEYHE